MAPKNIPQVKPVYFSFEEKMFVYIQLLSEVGKVGSGLHDVISVAFKKIPASNKMLTNLGKLCLNNRISTELRLLVPDDLGDDMCRLTCSLISD